MIEAELKARVHDPEAVVRLLDEQAPARVEIYQDTYYDTRGHALGAAGRELRIRTVEGPGGARTLLTFKDAVVDEASGSSPEHETLVADAVAAHRIVSALGFEPAITFEKRCRNYTLSAHGRQFLATLAHVPELAETFLEVETMAEPDDVAAALHDVREVMAGLGTGPGDMTREFYADAVAARRVTPDGPRRR